MRFDLKFHSKYKHTATIILVVTLFVKSVVVL